MEYIVDTAKDGFKTVDTVKKEPWVMIFMDIRMHPINGVENYKEI